MGGVGAVLSEELQRARSAGAAAQRVVLVEGASDQRAVEALARRQRRDLSSEGVAVVAIAGATNVDRFLEILGPGGYGAELAGLCDEAEESEFGGALQRVGLGTRLDRVTMERLGFFVCVRDLEEELIRAAGTDTVQQVIRSQGQLGRFRRFQNQPAQREKTIERQIWRWMGNHKIRYAPLLVEALDLEDVPRPLRGLLDHI